MSKDKGNCGTIINIGSSCSVKPFVSAPIYSATKHAIVALSKAYGVSILNVVLSVHFPLCSLSKFSSSMLQMVEREKKTLVEAKYYFKYKLIFIKQGENFLTS